MFYSEKFSRGRKGKEEKHENRKRKRKKNEIIRDYTY